MVLHILLTTALLGLTGSLHCAVMCGPISTARAPSKRSQWLARLLRYSPFSEPVTLGVATALLPCGFLYLALRHMDTEEKILFPLVLEYVKYGEVQHLGAFIDENEIQLIEHEDRTVGCEFDKICALAQRLNESCPNYGCVIKKLQELADNLHEHTEKERQYVAPILAKIVHPSSLMMSSQ